MRNEMGHFKALIHPIYIYNIDTVRSYLTLNILLFITKANWLMVFMEKSLFIVTITRNA